MILRTIGMATAGCVAAMSLMAGTALAGDYIVKLKKKSLAEEAIHQKSFQGYVIDDASIAGGLLSINLGKSTKKTTAAALAKLIADPDVEYVTQNFKLHALGMPNDPELSKQWAHEKVRAFEAWDTNVGSRETVVAIIDTGINSSHPDLAANAWTNSEEIAGNGIDDDGNGFIDDMVGWDFLDNDNDPDDITSQQNPGHGTHCAGIVGAVGDNNKGISGMSQAVSIMALRFIGPNGQGDLMAAINAIDYAIAANVDVISASWGAEVGASQAQPLIEAVERAAAADIVFVAAAANSGKNNDSTDFYPANVEAPGVIAVAASDSADAKPSWSNYGRAKVDLASPGLDIYSTLPGSSYGNLSGTSMATPLVAGLVALLKSEMRFGDNLTGPQIESLLQTTGAQVQIETACMCRVDAKSAIDHLGAGTLTVVPAAKTLAVGGSLDASAFGGSGEGYSFTSKDSAVIEATADGKLTAIALGETTISVEDSAGNTASSLILRVADAPTGGGGGECPLDPEMCQLLCMLDPTLPWCQ